MNARVSCPVDSITLLPYTPRLLLGCWQRKRGGYETGPGQEEALSLISRSVNNKNIDITRPYIKAAAFGSLCV